MSLRVLESIALLRRITATHVEQDVQREFAEVSLAGNVNLAGLSRSKVTS